MSTGRNEEVEEWPLRTTYRLLGEVESHSQFVVFRIGPLKVQAALALPTNRGQLVLRREVKICILQVVNSHSLQHSMHTCVHVYIHVGAPYKWHPEMKTSHLVGSPSYMYIKLFLKWGHFRALILFHWELCGGTSLLWTLSRQLHQQDSHGITTLFTYGKGLCMPNYTDSICQLDVHN